jgi:hypothetical protein
MKMAGLMMSKMASSAAVPMNPYQQPAGFDFRKAFTVSVHGFRGVARIVEQFDELAKQIEAEQP